MRSALLGAVAGLLFAAGLGVSGAARPEVVLGFLDPFGRWDPTLLVVLLSGSTTLGLLYRRARRRRPWFAPSFVTPVRKPIDRRLVVGAAFFGIGWGLVGVCPGLALVDATTAGPSALLFLAAMAGGVLLHDRVLVRLERPARRAVAPAAEAAGAVSCLPSRPGAPSTSGPGS